MSKTKGFQIDLTLPDGQHISHHMHKLGDLKDMVEKFKIPAITIHGTGDKWSGDGKAVSELIKWPIVPERLDDRLDDCPICVPKKERENK